MNRPEGQRRGTAAVLFVGTPRFDVCGAVRGSCDRPVAVDVVADGRRAIGWLTEAGKPTTDSVPPDLILVEFGFDSPDGETLLHAIASSPRLRDAAVVAVGADQPGAETGGETAADARVESPDSVDEYADLVGSITRSWLE
jgi:CheY-like chemotaxis protein